MQTSTPWNAAEKLPCSLLALLPTCISDLTLPGLLLAGRWHCCCCAQLAPAAAGVPRPGAVSGRRCSCCWQSSRREVGLSGSSSLWGSG